MNKQGYTMTEILRAYVQYLNIYCGDTCNTNEENWKLAIKKYHNDKIDVLMLEHHELLKKR